MSRSSMLLSLQPWEPRTLPRRAPTTDKKKVAKQKNRWPCRIYSWHFFFSLIRSFCYFTRKNLLPTLAHDLERYKTTTQWRRTSHQSTATPRRVTTPTHDSSYLALCPFQQLRHNDHLLHTRCCQLLLPSHPQPPTEGRSRLRHLWVHRAAHRQAIPSVRRMHDYQLLLP